MSENDVGLILAKLEFVAKEFQDFKSTVKEEFVLVKTDYKSKCTTCLNFNLLKQEVEAETKSFFSHIKALWATIGTVALAVLVAFLNHLWGK